MVNSVTTQLGALTNGTANVSVQPVAPVAVNVPAVSLEPVASVPVPQAEMAGPAPCWLMILPSKPRLNAASARPDVRTRAKPAWSSFFSIVVSPISSEEDERPLGRPAAVELNEGDGLTRGRRGAGLGILGHGEHGARRGQGPADRPGRGIDTSQRRVDVAGGHNVVVGRADGANRIDVGGDRVEGRHDLGKHRDDEGGLRKIVLERDAVGDGGVVEVRGLLQGVGDLARILTSRNA